MASLSARSQMPACALTPCARISLLVVSSAACPRAQIETAAPAPANASAIERPIPRLPPVTTVRLPFKLISIKSSPQACANSDPLPQHGPAARAPPGQRETSAEHWHHLLGDALELFEHHGFRRAQAGAQIDMLHARKARFEPLAVFDQLFSRARKPRAKLHIVVERRHTRLAPAAPLGRRRHLR